jgi:hypothetical protein
VLGLGWAGAGRRPWAGLLREREKRGEVEGSWAEREKGRRPKMNSDNSHFLKDLGIEF